MPKSLAFHLPTDQKAAETSIAIKSYLDEFCGNRKAVSIALNLGCRIVILRYELPAAGLCTSTLKRRLRAYQCP